MWKERIKGENTNEKGKNGCGKGDFWVIAGVRGDMWVRTSVGGGERFVKTSKKRRIMGENRCG